MKIRFAKAHPTQIGIREIRALKISVSEVSALKDRSTETPTAKKRTAQVSRRTLFAAGFYPHSMVIEDAPELVIRKLAKFGGWSHWWAEFSTARAFREAFVRIMPTGALA